MWDCRNIRAGGDIPTSGLLCVLAAAVILCVGDAGHAQDLAGRIISRAGTPVQGGNLVFQAPALGGKLLETYVGDDGTFVIGPVVAGNHYRVEYYFPGAGGEWALLEDWQPKSADFKQDLQELQFQIVGGGALRVVSRESAVRVAPRDQVVVRRFSPFALSFGATMITGDEFNGTSAGHDAGIGLSGTVTYLLPVGGSHAAESGRERRFHWLLGAGLGQNRYTVPQRTSESTAAVAYNRGQFFTGPYWMTSGGRLELGLGGAIATGGIYDGSKRLDLPQSGSFDISSYGVFGTVARQLGAGPLRVAARVEMMSNSGDHVPDFWKGPSTLFTVGLTYRPPRSESWEIVP